MRRRWALLIAAVMTAAIPAIGATPAAAEPGDCWHNGADMPGSTCGRNTYVLDPGLGSVLNRGAILRHAAYYANKGFSPNFLWYAPEGERVFPVGNTETWSGCTVDAPTGQTCAPGAHEFHPVLGSFSDDDVHNLPIRLPSLSFGNGFIALACGNFSEGTAAKPIPVISGHKFHDRDRDGVRDADEPGLAGWTMTLSRDRSDAGQGIGGVATAVTNGDGYYEFPLDGHYPGAYAVTEENRADWTRTTNPARHTIEVHAGIADQRFEGNNFGNVETTADAVKSSFTLIDPPAEMSADTEHTLRLRAVLGNRGQAPIIDVVDTVTASGPADCAFRPAQPSVTRRLTAGSPVEVIFEIGVTCTEPSFHPLLFDNTLTITTPGVTDPDLSSNHRTTGATIAVIDESDVAVTATALDCASRTYVTDHVACTVTATVDNHGDHADAVADVTLGLTGPADCALTPAGAIRHEDQPIAAGTPTVVATTWDVTCADRSFHDFAATADVALDLLHVIDPDAANNHGGATDQVEVFERVDLSIVDLRLTCSERHYETANTTCVSTVTVGNAGPATAVLTRTDVTFTAPADCAVTPAAPQQDLRTLDAGTTATFTKTWDLTCTEPRRHTFGTTATISADEPHPEDIDRANDTRSIGWQPIDVKPRSYPSSINLKKEGLVPLAILSTTEFDALTQVDRQSLTFGATGTENSLVRCATAGEDVNDDGLLDLICQFDTIAMALTCASTTATVMGRTVDGLRFEGQDDIKVTGC
jgi:hypothetical protein